MPNPSRPRSLRSRAVCVAVLAGALLVLRESDEQTTTQNDTNTNTANGSRWAVWVALRKHPPSLRIFRSLLEWNLLLWGTVASLALWYRYVGADMVADLLFASAQSCHMDAADDWGAAHDAQGRKNAYAQVYQQEEDDHNASELIFSDPHASFSEVMTGTQEEEPFTDAASKDTATKDNASDETSDSQQQAQQQQQDNDEEDDKEDTGDEEIESQSPSSFDAQGSALAPSVNATAGAALDMLLPILISLFFFTLLSSQKSARIAPQLEWLAPLIPILLVAYLTATQLFRPWKPRKHFLIVVGWTMGAPLFPVTFRDGFIGDIFTSTVRPLQDVAFTVCYIFSGFQGYWSDGYEGFWDSVNHNPHHLNDDDDAIAAEPTEAPFAHSMLPPLETSWFLHTFLLPMCMVSPLWWRFLQNLRQTHDNRRRWPYLGNAFKYLLAAEVAMFGVFDPSKQETYLWLGWFVVATLYQVWWDVFMDWELLVPNNQTQSTMGWWGWCFPYRLRENRLYPSKSLYTFIMVVNFTLRFCWTLSFLPPRYLNEAGVLSDTFQHSDWSRALAPAIASAEIIRRTLWGWIRLECEAIKVKQEREQPLLPSAAMLELQYRGDNPEEAFGDMLDGMEPMDMGHGGGGGMTQQRWSFSKRQGIIPALIEKLKTMEHHSEIQILAELSIWAAIFTTLGMVAAAHRMTL